MAAAKFLVPNEEQARWLRECGIDPQGYVVRSDSDNSLCLLHLKTRNEVLISKNKRAGKSA